MKIITFFSEKGGVGKSSFSIMYASWLKFQYGIKVGVADFNKRLSDYRLAEIDARRALIEKNPDLDIKPLLPEQSWPIVEASYIEVKEYEKNGSQFPNASWLKDEITIGRLKDCDVVLCDFAGSLDDKKYTHCLIQGLISLTVTPIEKDSMTVKSTLNLYAGLKKYSVNHKISFANCVFVNKAQLGLRNYRKQYIDFAKFLKDKNLPVLPDIVSYSERMTSMNKVDNIRSTFGFPDFESPEYGMSKDLGIGNLFIDITKELAKRPDIKGTPKADLSFINDVQKKNDGRQFSGSAFPEYEI